MIDMSESSGKWLFVEENPNDRMKSTVRRDALGGSELSREARVVREAIQNSVDATLENQKTNVVIWNKSLSGSESDTFRELIGFRNSVSPFSRLRLLGLQSGNALERMKSGKGKGRGFNVTIIEDWNTCGLEYDRQSEVDRFDELCLSFGQDVTTVDPNRGGSYGFGKHVYEEASDCNMFIVYSVFRPIPPTAPNEVGSHARLFACATFRGHEVGNTKYRGRALFGIFKGEDSTTECRPIVDEEAHEMAAKLGFRRRKPNETGTSIMIVGTHVDTARFKEAIENYWWPRLYSNLLSVELRDDDVEAGHPEPKTREDLQPYLRCWSLIEEGIPKDDTERTHALRSNAPALQQGKLALKPLAQGGDVPDDSEHDTDLKNTVALIRSGPRMVVRYLEPGGRSSANFAGVFLSNPDVEKELHLSEPASHDNWSPDASRFDDAFPEPEERERGRGLVKSVLVKIKNHARSFRRDLVPIAPPTPMAGSRTLQNILGRLMSGATPGTQHVPRRDNLDPFTINIQTGRRNTASSSQVTARIDVTLNQRAPAETAQATLTIEPYLAMDDDIKKDSQSVLQLHEAQLDGESVEYGDNCIPVALKKGTITNVDIASEDFPREFYAGLDVAVKIESFEAEGTSVDFGGQT